jgi:hypothetical protein
MGWGRKGSGAGGFVCRVRVCATQTLRGSSPYNTPPDCLTRWLSPEGWTMYPAMGDTSYSQLLAGSVIRSAACTIQRRGRLAVGGVSVAAVVGRLLQPGRRAAKWLNANAPTRPVEAGRQSPASPTATDSTAIGELLRFHMHAKPPTATDQLTTNQPTARHITTADSTRLDSTRLETTQPNSRAIRPSTWPYPVPAASLTDLPWAGLLGRPGHPPPTCTASGWGDLGWVPAAADREAAQRACGQPHTTNQPRPTTGGRPPRARVLDADRACEPVRLVSRHVLPADGTRAAAAGHSAFWRDRPSKQANLGGAGGLLIGRPYVPNLRQAASRKCPSSPQILPA